MSYSRNDMNLFKYGEFVLISGVLFYNSYGGEPDEISRHVRSSVSYAWEKDVFESSLTHSRHIYNYGWRPTINVKIDLVSSAMIIRTRQLIAILNDEDKRSDLDIVIDFYDYADTSPRNLYSNMYLDSEINPQEISSSLRLGETLSLTFRGKNLLDAMYVIPSEIGKIKDNLNNILADISGNEILSLN